MNMKMIKSGALTAFAASLFILGGCFAGPDPKAVENVAKHLSKPPKNWYEETLNYYVYGAETGWKDDSLYGDILPEMKDPNNRFGYYLADLNDDGTKELLIGYADDKDETRFTELYIYHPDLERAVHSFSNCGDGYYLYLCEGNIIKLDSWYGSETKTDYMTMNKDPTAGFPIGEYTDPPKPLKCNLVPFDEVGKALENNDK